MTLAQLRGILAAIPPEFDEADVDVATFDGRYSLQSIRIWTDGLSGEPGPVLVLGDAEIFAGYPTPPDVVFQMLD